MWPENRLALIVCAFTGLRITQVLSLESYQLRDGSLWYCGRSFWLPSNVYAALNRISGKKYIFTHRDYPDSHHRTRQAVYKDLLRAQRDTGLTIGLTPFKLTGTLLPL